jgi:Xaa-Pro dipeptidase
MSAPRADIGALQAQIRAAGLDAVLTVSGANFTYVTDTLILSHEIIPERLCMVIVPAEGAPLPLVCLPEAKQVRQDSWISDLRTYVEFKEDPMVVLAQLLAELGLSNGRIGIESLFLAVTYERQLATALPGATITAADGVFDRARAVKTQTEIDILSAAARATEIAIYEAFSAARPGDTEKQLADDVTARLLKAGATSRWIVLAAGANSAINHPYPSAKQLTKGETLRVDVGGVFDGYQSDVARTAVVGQATDEQQSRYQRLREIERETIAAARPGVRACDLYAVCRKAYEKRGMELCGAVVGHSIGITLHEHPVLRAEDETELKPGMLFNVEPATIDSQGFLYHIEDLLLVTEGEPVIVTTNMDTERLFVI